MLLGGTVYQYIAYSAISYQVNWPVSEMWQREKREGGGNLERQCCSDQNRGCTMESISGKPVLGAGKGEHLEKEGGGIRRGPQ